MSNVGVLKTYNKSAIFNNRLSWFIYTPTENIRITKKIHTFWYFILILINIVPNIVKTQEKSTLSHISHSKSQPTIQTTFFLYKYKNQRKSTLLPINNFSSKIILIKSKLTTPTFISNST